MGGRLCTRQRGVEIKKGVFRGLLGVEGPSGLRVQATPKVCGLGFM